MPRTAQLRILRKCCICINLAPLFPKSYEHLTGSSVSAPVIAGLNSADKMQITHTPFSHAWPLIPASAATRQSSAEADLGSGFRAKK